MKEKKNINLHPPPPQQSKKEEKKSTCTFSPSAPFPPSHNEFVRSRSGINDSLSSTSSTDLDREQVSSTPCGGKRRMHEAQHKKQQRIGKRIAASLSAASNQKPKKRTPPQEQHCSF
jgi:hypothetical protein